MILFYLCLLITIHKMPKNGLVMRFSINTKKYRVFTKYPVCGCGGRTRTCDLRVMSPTSFQLLYPAIFHLCARAVQI